MHATERATSFDESLKRSHELEADLALRPEHYRVLTGDRPTGSLHIGHLFGSLENRVRLQKLGVDVCILIADYQVLTDRDSVAGIRENIREIVLDYLAAGIDPSCSNVHIFCHSYVPALNQLLLPFLALVTMAELDRNPTTKEEVAAAGLRNVNALMYTYPVHQAADILACRGNLVPVGKDQLPHLELARKIARRFNERYGAGETILAEPDALLSDAPLVLGLDGLQKMSKSRGNAVPLKASEDETAALIKKAKTDVDPQLSYDPVQRPELSNLLRIAARVTGRTPQAIAADLGHGSGRLKAYVTEQLNAYLRPIRARRAEYAKDPAVVEAALSRGVEYANAIADRSLAEVRRCMQMEYEADFTYRTPKT